MVIKSYSYRKISKNAIFKSVNNCMVFFLEGFLLRLLFLMEIIKQWFLRM